MSRFLLLVVVAAVCCLLGARAAASEALKTALGSPDILFHETFDTDPFAAGTWHKSAAAKYAEQPVLIRPPTHPIKGFEDDQGLVLSQERKFYGVYSPFARHVSFKDSREFVLQYELRLEETVTCSGAYLKLPRAAEGLDLSMLDNDTPYTVMFGVDKCGSDANKVGRLRQIPAAPLSHH